MPDCVHAFVLNFPHQLLMLHLDVEPHHVFVAPELKQLLPSNFISLLDLVSASLCHVPVSEQPLGEGVFLQPRKLVGSDFRGDLLVEHSLVEFDEHAVHLFFADVLVTGLLDLEGNSFIQLRPYLIPIHTLQHLNLQLSLITCINVLLGQLLYLPIA